MSKMDNLRAMREARYEAAQKLAKGAPTTSGATPAAKAVSKPAAAKAPKAAKTGSTAPGGEPEAAEALCGHRNMSGRTCTREQGHSAKSHRYS